MVQVRIAVGRGGEMSVVVRARSIQRALEIVARRFPRQDKQVVFPLDPDSFFARRGYEGVYVPASEQVVA